MSYDISVRIINDTEDNLLCVEKSCWENTDSCTWTTLESGRLLSMAGSGTSGMLRFNTSPAGEYFALIVGVHNYKRWCDIVVDLKGNDTLMKLHPQYYGGSAARQTKMRQNQLAEYSVATKGGKKISIEFYQKEGQKLFANLTYA